MEIIGRLVFSEKLEKGNDFLFGLFDSVFWLFCGGFVVEGMLKFVCGNVGKKRRERNGEMVKRKIKWRSEGSDD